MWINTTINVTNVYLYTFEWYIFGIDMKQGPMN